MFQKLNPSYKCISIVVFAIILSFSFSVEINVVVFIITLFATLTVTSIRKIGIFMIPVLLTAIGLFMTGVIFTEGNQHTEYAASLVANMDITSAYNGLQLATRVLAYAGIGMLFSFSTDGIAFVYSLQQQLKLSPKFAYGMLAAFHLMPNMKREYELSRFALMTRGGKVSVFAPIKAMFVNAIRSAEHLSIAMESKGFESEGERSYYYVYSINLWDIGFLIVPNVLLLLVMIL